MRWLILPSQGQLIFVPKAIISLISSEERESLTESENAIFDRLLKNGIPFWNESNQIGAVSFAKLTTSRNQSEGHKFSECPGSGFGLFQSLLGPFR